MTTIDFPLSLKYVLENEGGNDDDPSDHGGRTSRGITQREYDAYCRLHNLPGGDVWKASQGVIDAIYHDTYWEPWGDWMPTPIDYQFFDMAVNAGPHRAIVLMQRALGVNDDGIIGPITREAIMNSEPELFTKLFAEEKALFYRSIARGSQRKYLRGWLNRVADVKANALGMIPKAGAMV